MKKLYTDIIKHKFEFQDLRSEDQKLIKVKWFNYISYLMFGLFFYIFATLALLPIIREMMLALEGEVPNKFDPPGWGVVVGGAIIFYFIHAFFKAKLDHLRCIIYYNEK